LRARRPALQRVPVPVPPVRALARLPQGLPQLPALPLQVPQPAQLALPVRVAHPLPVVAPWS
jgi:hypothetical protein